MAEHGWEVAGNPSAKVLSIVVEDLWRRLAFPAWRYPLVMSK